MTGRARYTKPYDFIVVGGGTAGCVLASRLSECRDIRVLLIEAGSESPPRAAASPAMWPTLLGTQLDWCSTTVSQVGLGGAVLNYPRGKGLGGSSGIGALAHVRGHPAGYDGWVSQGALGWSYMDLLPYFRKTETTTGRDPSIRGWHGPMIIPSTFAHHPIAEAFVEACERHGYRLSDDLNGAQPEGVCWYDRNIVGGRRQSAADAYLRPVMDRHNLTVLSTATATRLILEGGRCIGVMYQRDGQVAAVHAEREVIVSAGAIGSPQLLQLSGLGPADLLRACGIRVVVDIPAVGQNLSDHSLGVVVYACAKPLPPPTNNHIDAMAAIRIGGATTEPDAHLLIGDVPLAPPGYASPPNGFTIGFSMLRPHSRGSVRIASNDPTAAPLIDPGFLTDERDVEFNLRAVRLAREIGRSGAFHPWRPVEVIPGPNISSDEDLRTYLRGGVRSYFHPSGTCRMGVDADAVTDTQLRVRGVSGLRVIDASVMPSLPSASLNATVLAIAEKGAELISSSRYAATKPSQISPSTLEAPNCVADPPKRAIPHNNNHPNGSRRSRLG